VFLKQQLHQHDGKLAIDSEPFAPLPFTVIGGFPDLKVEGVSVFVTSDRWCVEDRSRTHSFALAGEEYYASHVLGDCEDGWSRSLLGNDGSKQRGI
jgi:hypothetical protein